MTFLDGLHSMPQLSAYSREALKDLKSRAVERLESLVPITAIPAQDQSIDPQLNVQIGPFAIPKGPYETSAHDFSLEAPTTYQNVMRVVRACQLPKPILLEGSPGVGKTSLITSLAKMCGFQLCRINLSDQSDLMDLFGSDLPVEDGQPGQFAWKDAEFLRALQQGHWVLLDEMNLAPQAVLEGLNAVLDHRGTVYIPELGRSFTRHPSFRIFAAQNPLHQGGGRKGLPRSFLNRFTKVYVQELTVDDLHSICRHLFPERSAEELRAMIDFTALLEEETMNKKSFGREGSPWEFNLRDVLRWAMLLRRAGTSSHPSQFLNTVFLQRFRSIRDRESVYSLFTRIFPSSLDRPRPNLTISSTYLQAGNFFTSRQGALPILRCGPILQSHDVALESMMTGIVNGWLTIVTGPRESGKTTLIRLLANLTGRRLHEISVNNATDAADILGGFEEADNNFEAASFMEELDSFQDELCRTVVGLNQQVIAQCDALRQRIGQFKPNDNIDDILRLLATLFEQNLPEWCINRRDFFNSKIEFLRNRFRHPGRLRWVDGPLVRALKEGHWLLLDEANLCNPSVLDRLNSLCETDGFLVLNERGQVDGEAQTIKPHPNFRLFMCVDPQFGELSRAMRNRGIEVSLAGRLHDEDAMRVLDHTRVPRISLADRPDLKLLMRDYEGVRRSLHALDVLSSVPTWPTARLLGEDSANSALVDLVPSLSIVRSSPYDDRALAHFMMDVVMPGYVNYIQRFCQCLFTLGTLPYLQTALSVLRNFTSSRLYSIVADFVEESSHLFAIPSELLMVQVSVN